MKKTTNALRIPAPHITRDNPAAYIILPGKSHGSYEYPDIEVGMHRLSYTPFMDKIAEKLDIKLKNTAAEGDGTPYIGEINRKEALTLNLSLGNFTLNPLQFIDFKKLLEIGMNGKKRVHDGNGKRIESRVLEAVHEEIFAIIEPWRGEHLDAQFIEKNGILYFESGHRLKGNDLVSTISEALEICLKEYVGVDVSSFNKQGFPIKKSRKHQMDYWPPVNGAVAWLVASSVRANLYCDRDPTYRDASLGVRPSREKK